jgi:large subunit ribosomal protein L17
MLRNLVTSLLDHERVETTHAKARELRRIADRMITLGKKGDLHARRRALSVLQDRGVAAKVFTDLADRFRERPGGYTRVTKLRVRVGDAAPLSIVQLVDGPAAVQKSAKTETPRRARKKKDDETSEGKATRAGSRSRKGRGAAAETKGRGRKSSEAKPGARPKASAAKPRRATRTRKTD